MLQDDLPNLTDADEDDDFDDVGCFAPLPPLIDPLSMLTSDRLINFQSQNQNNWQNFDRFEIVSFPSQDYTSKAYINNARLPLNRKIIHQHVEGLRSLEYQTEYTFPLFDLICPYCRADMFQAELHDWEEDESLRWKSLESCPNCHYWRWHDTELDGLDFWTSNELGYSIRYFSFLSKIREFEGNFPEGFTQEIAAWIRRNELNWHTMKPSFMEKLVADILRYNFQPCEVFHVGKPGDGGVDVLFIDSDRNQWLVQVKRRERQKCSEPVETIKNLIGTMFLNDASYGMVVSTADHFTYQAYRAINQAQARGMVIELIDRGKLNRMLNFVLPDRPWKAVIREEYPESSEYFEEAIPSTTYKQLSLFD